MPRGKLVAIVGAVGAGKSSLVSAMLGEMDKLSGEVFLDVCILYNFYIFYYTLYLDVCILYNLQYIFYYYMCVIISFTYYIMCVIITFTYLMRDNNKFAKFL